LCAIYIHNSLIFGFCQVKAASNPIKKDNGEIVVNNTSLFVVKEAQQALSGNVYSEE